MNKQKKEKSTHSSRLFHSAAAAAAGRHLVHTSFSTRLQHVTEFFCPELMHFTDKCVSLKVTIASL